MDEQEFRKQLTLKPVEEEHIDQIKTTDFRTFKSIWLVSRKSINFTNCYLSMRSQYPWCFI